MSEKNPTLNLVTNGSFEAEQFQDKWTITDSITGWQSTNGIEIQNKDVLQSADGNHHAELDVGENSSIFQDIKTGEGIYKLEFQYSPRPNYTAESNVVEVYWEGNLIDTYSSDTVGWETKTYELTATGDVSRLEFKGAGASDAHGALIDDVKLNWQSEIVDKENLITGNSLNDTIDGTSADDLVYGLEGDDLIKGALGNDTLWGWKGNDTLAGGDGDDLVGGDDGDDIVSGDAGNDRVYGGSGDDVITGGTGDDIVGGDAGNDKVYGNEGDDRVYGGDGDDVLVGGQGDDIIGGDAGNDKLFGGQGNDRLYGGAGNDIIDAGDGNDTAGGGAGNDKILGGEGNDELHGGAGNDVLIGDTSTLENLVKNGSFEDGHITNAWTVYDSVEGWDSTNGIEIQNNHIIQSSDGQYYVELDGHENSAMYQDIETGKGAFTLEFDFSPRPDVSAKSNQIEVYWEGSLIDTLTGDSAGWETKSYDIEATGDVSRLEFKAAGTSDSYGGFLDNIKLNAQTNDALSGGEGDDLLTGGAGADVLTGGEGSDTFIFAKLTDSTTSSTDKITDFQKGVDIIQLSGLGFSGIKPGAASGASLGYEYVDGHTVITAEGSDFSIELKGEIHLDDGDFHF